MKLADEADTGRGWPEVVGVALGAAAVAVPLILLLHWWVTS